MNTPLHGFTEIRQAPLPELDATLHEMEHEPGWSGWSGTR